MPASGYPAANHRPLPTGQASVLELFLKAGVGATTYVMAALVFDAAGARSALQQISSRRARRV